MVSNFSDYVTLKFSSKSSHLFSLGFCKVILFGDGFTSLFIQRYWFMILSTALFNGPFVTSIQGLLNLFFQLFFLNKFFLFFQGYLFFFWFLFHSPLYGFFSYWHFKPLTSAHDTLASVPLQPVTALFYANLFLVPSSCPFPSFWL